MKLDFPTGLGLYVGLSHPNIKLEIVKSPCTLLIFEIEKEKIMYELKSFMQIVGFLGL